MQISICLNPAHLQRWHAWLIDLLARDGHKVGLRFENTGFRYPSALAALLALQRVVGGGGERAADSIDAKDLLATSHADASGETAAADLEICLTDEDPAMRRSRTPALRPLYNGSHDESSLWLSLLHGQAPVLALADGGGHIVEIARPVLENPNSLPRSADNVFSRLVEGLVLACNRTRTQVVGAPRPNAPVARNAAAPDIPLTAVGALAWKYAQTLAGNALAKLLRTAPTWHTAWRSAPGGRTHLQPLADLNAYSRIINDGQRFYADPFVIFHGGLHHVFIEELPYATQKGHIAHFSIDAAGRAGPVTPVLECAHHLSYPQIFTHDGEIYMLPEASTSGRLDLYRAERFPNRWVPVATLIDTPLHDATLFEHEGRFYITAGTQILRSASYDSLAVYSAPSPFGPWTAHPGNPILIDARISRPAGDVYSYAGSLWRPTQNGTRGYGSSIELARITALDETRFEQEQAASHMFCAAGRVMGPHTINWCAGIEVVDYFASYAALERLKA